MAADENIQGVWAPALTPLDDRGAPDPARSVEHINWLLDQGCHGIALFGTTGEATSFSVGERQAMLEGLLAADIDPKRLMVGSGCAAVTDSIALTAHACANGCTDVLVLPPFYYKGVSDDGLFAAYAEVIERVGDERLGVFLYNFPKQTALPISLALTERLLSAYPKTIRGIKDSSGDAASTRAYLENFPELAIFPGNELLMSEMMALGGAGTITATANVNAAAIRRAYDAARAGDPEAGALQAAIGETRRLIQGFPMIPALKEIVAGLRGDPGWLRLRPPMVALSEAQKAALHEGLAKLGLRLAA